jgi:hypothetical protein
MARPRLGVGSENIWRYLKEFLFLHPVKLCNSVILYSCVTMYVNPLSQTQRILPQANLVCTLGYLKAAYQLRSWVAYTIELLDNCELRTGGAVGVSGRNPVKVL